MIGPFIHFNNLEICKPTLITHKTGEDDGEKCGDFMTSPLGHSELFDIFMKCYPGYDLEYMDYPRGRVVYNYVLGIHTIWIDKCILHKIPDIVFSYDLKEYIIGEDIHYVCPKCERDIWDD